MFRSIFDGKSELRATWVDKASFEAFFYSSKDLELNDAVGTCRTILRIDSGSDMWVRFRNGTTN